MAAKKKIPRAAIIVYHTPVQATTPCPSQNPMGNLGGATAKIGHGDDWLSAGHEARIQMSCQRAQPAKIAIGAPHLGQVRGYAGGLTKAKIEQFGPFHSSGNQPP